SDAQRYAAHLADEQGAQPVQRSLALRRRREERERAFLGDEDVRDAHIVASAAAKPGGGPRVEHSRLVSRDNDEADLRLPWREHPGALLRRDEATEDVHLRVGAAAC